MNIAFIQTSALGDCLLSTCVLRDLRRQAHPADRITWFIFDQYREVAANNPDCDDYMAWPLGTLPRQQQEGHKWNEIFQYVHAHGYEKIVCPQVYPWRDWTKYPGMHLLDQMYEKAGVQRDPATRIRFHADASPSDQPYVCVNSQSNTQSPLWSAEQWSDLERRLADDGVRMVNGDTQRFTLKQWASLIAGASCYVGLDSGGSWLAAATDTPQIALYRRKSSCPPWLVSLKASGVKADVSEMFDPTPEWVREAIRGASRA